MIRFGNVFSALPNSTRHMRTNKKNRLLWWRGYDMPRQPDVPQTIEHLTGLKCSLSQSLQNPGDPWLWELEVNGPAINGQLLPWVQKFKQSWETFARDQRFRPEIHLIKALGALVQGNYFERNGTSGYVSEILQLIEIRWIF